MLAALGTGDASALEAVKAELDEAEVRVPSFTAFTAPAGALYFSHCVHQHSA
jgi:hypothetical protein